MKNEPVEASPMKSLAEELNFARKTFNDTLKNYGARIESEIVRIREAVLEQAAKGKHSATRLHDARDMISLLRNLEVKAEKGRRRDLKRIESVVEDLQRLIENW